jgi:hypothetical protein
MLQRKSNGPLAKLRAHIYGKLFSPPVRFERTPIGVTAPKPSHDLSVFAGTYHNAGFGDARITATNDTLAQHWERLTLPPGWGV